MDKRFSSLKLVFLFVLGSLSILPLSSEAALESRFDVITLRPAIDSGDYFTVYGSQNLREWQANIGVYLDYANRPLQFVSTGAATGRQSVVEHLFVADVFGGFGVTDWFEVGLNIPLVVYNWFFVDDSTAREDHGGGVGDIQFTTKFRLVNTDDHPVGFAIAPFFTVPSGDVTRYMGNGHVTGGAKLITDFMFHERFTMALNVGAVFRDDVLRHSVRIDDQFDFGMSGNIKFTQNFHGIFEVFGRTNFRNMFQQTAESPLEAGGGLRYVFGDSGISGDVGATAGIIDGVGSPRVRGFAGLRYTTPVKEKCVECAPPPPPDPRIRGDKIIIWGKIFFDTNKAIIKPISYPVLADVIDVMQKNPQLTLVEVQGHTDARASDAYNLKLSDNRANSVREYLIQNGVVSYRLISRGYGESQPIASNSTKEGMSQNRRVEFVILQRSN